ncbi:MAG: 4Fe-4S binding protein [Spirochaetes bacterium]|nr:4Fe-4S binding protein [Spirochaetota bacterium]
MIQVDMDKCTGCRVCFNVCPQDVIKMENKKAYIENYVNCMECGACALNCEYNAINLTKGTGCLGAIIREDILKIRQKATGCGCGDDKKLTGCC